MPSSLITRARYSVPLSGNRETDKLTALCRGLREYLESLRFTDPVGGREFAFDHVVETWAPPETPAAMPAAAVYTTEKGVITPAKMAPTFPDENKLPDGRYLLDMGEFSLDLNVEVWSKDAAQRRAFAMALDDAFCPVAWAYGFRLVLPHYFNAIATYTPLGTAFADSETEAARGHKVMTIGLAASVRFMRVIAPLPMTTQVQLTVDKRPPDIITADGVVEGTPR